MADDRRVCVFASFAPKHGREDEVRAVLDEMAHKTRAEPGCQVYDLYQDDAGTTFRLFERYTGQEALDFHRSSEHYIAYRKAIAELLQAPIDVVVLREANVAS